MKNVNSLQLMTEGNVIKSSYFYKYAHGRNFLNIKICYVYSYWFYLIIRCHHKK